MEQFLKEYGTRGFQLMVREFIARAPEQLSDSQLAEEIAQALDKLQRAFEAELDSDNFEPPTVGNRVI